MKKYKLFDDHREEFLYFRKSRREQIPKRSREDFRRLLVLLVSQKYVLFELSWILAKLRMTGTKIPLFLGEFYAYYLFL